MFTVKADTLFANPMRAKHAPGGGSSLSMNRAGCGSQTRGPDRASVRRSDSWSQCVRKSERRLPMNLVAADVRRLTFQMRSAECGTQNWARALTSAATVRANRPSQCGGIRPQRPTLRRKKASREGVWFRRARSPGTSDRNADTALEHSPRRDDTVPTPR